MDTQNKNFNSNENTRKEDENKVMRLEWDPVPFIAVGKMARTSTKKLAILIREKLQTQFHDLKGCRIDYDFNTRNFVTTLVFENNASDVPEGKIKNLVNVAKEAPQGRDLFAANRALQNKYHGNTYALSKETKILLSEFMYGGRDGNKPDSKSWNRNVKEHLEPANAAYSGIAYNFNRFDSERILILVTGIDIRVLLRKLYGTAMVEETKTYSDGSQENVEAPAFYDLRFIKNAPDGSCIINIEQINKNEVEKIMAKESVLTNVANGPYRYY